MEPPQIDSGKLQYVFNHVFLPIKLPGKDDETVDREAFLCSLLLKALRSFQSLQQNDHQNAWEAPIQMIECFQDAKTSTGKLSAADLFPQLQDLAAGDFLALHVKAQNAGVVIQRTPEETVFHMFEVSATSEAVTSTKGRLLRCFPGPAIAIDNGRFADQTFVHEIAKLFTALDSETPAEVIPQTRKAGQKHSETRDTINPRLVTEMTAAMLRALGRPAHVDRFYKQTRDEVVWHDSFNPWRRSPLWLLLRVALRISLEVKNDPIGSENLFKQFMLHFMAEVAILALENDFSSDMLFTMIAKLNRRALKLELSEEPAWFVKLNQTISAVYERLESRWHCLEKPQDSINKSQAYSLTGLTPNDDSHLTVERLRQYLHQLETESRAVSATQRKSSNVGVPRIRNTCNGFPEFSSLQAGIKHDDNGIILADFECWVRDSLPNWTRNNLDKAHVHTVVAGAIFRYTKAATEQYSGSPEDLSIMFLTSLELWVAFDKVILRHLPMMNDYKPEISLKLLEPFLLKTKAEMVRIASVEEYIRNREMRAKPGYPSVLRSFADANSLSLRYFQQSQEHQLLKHRIDQNTEVQKTEKLREYERKCKHHEELMSLYDSSQCDTVQEKNNAGKLVSKHYGSRCKRHQLLKQASDITINEYEVPLPALRNEAEAVVFELSPPSLITSWRDTTFFILMEMFAKREAPQSQGEVRPLCKYTALQSFAQNTGRLALASSTKPFAVTHYQHPKLITSIVKGSDLIVNNGMHYAMHDSERSTWMTAAYLPVEDVAEDVREECTFRFPDSWSSLQYAINGCSHTSNQVIARQNTYPSELNPHEAYSIGTLRAGHRLQWCNILRELVNGNIDFARFEIYLLITQAAWQIGPPDGRNFLRQSHVDLLDGAFAIGLIEALNTNLQRIEGNWQGVSALSSFATLATRLSSVSQSDSIRDACLTFLRRSRQVAFQWAHQISVPSDAAVDTKTALEMRSRRLEIALVCHMTYAINVESLLEILQNDEDISTFTQCSAIIHDCSMGITAINDRRLSHLMNRSKRLSHTLEPVLRQQIIGRSAGLDRTVKSLWTSYVAQNPWSAGNDPYQRYLETTTTPIGSNKLLTVQFDLLTGRLLVDGHLLSRLPAEYERHEMYRRVLGVEIVDVIPSVMTGFAFQSRCKFLGHQLYFNMTEERDLVIRAELNGTLYELIRPALLDAAFPVHFVRDYAHWLNVESQSIEFRPLETAWEPCTAHWKLRHNASGRTWLQKGSSRLIDLRSKTAQRILMILRPLEVEENIHVVYDKDTENVKVHLPRFMLDFVLMKGAIYLESRQFQGMVIDHVQSIGTLTGLDNKLVLRGVADVPRLVLIPRGSVQYQAAGHHTQVNVDTSTLKTVRYHSYEMDDLLQRIVDDETTESKLYRGYLHALTAHCLPDTFLGRTGTEEALSIVSQPSMKSHVSLSADAVNLLQEIQGCSPKRRYYPSNLKSMQDVGWSPLPSLSQHPSFYTLVESILEHMRSIEFLSDSPCSLPKPGSLEQLELLQKSEIRDAQLRTFEYGARNHNVKDDSNYASRDHRPNSDAEGIVYRTAHIVDLWSTDLDVTPNLLTLVECLDQIHPCAVNSLPTIGYDPRWLALSKLTLSEHLCSLIKFLSKSRRDCDKYRILTTLSTMSYSQRADQKLVETLLAFATTSRLRECSLQPLQILKLSKGYSLDEMALLPVIKAHFRCAEIAPESRLPREPHEAMRRWTERKDAALITTRQVYAHRLVEGFEYQWRITKTLTADLPGAEVYIDLLTAANESIQWFMSWDNNADFRDQILRVQERLGEISSSKECRSLYSFSRPPRHYKDRKSFIDWKDAMMAPPPSLRRDGPAGFEAWLNSSERDHTRDEKLSSLLAKLREEDASNGYESSYIEQLHESFEQRPRNMFEQNPDIGSLGRKVALVLKERSKVAAESYEVLCQGLKVSPTGIGRPALAVQLSLRLSNLSVLQLLATSKEFQGTGGWKDCLIEYGVILSELQHARRLSRCLGSNSDLALELIGGDHDHWSPSARPDWLLFELENNLMIRKAQVEIAEEMMSPTSGANSIMQLNMGEGKSSVIVPIAAATLADRNQLLRVIVLKPLAKQMLSLLIKKLGGMLNRRIYHLPISRSVRLTVAQAEYLQKMCEECLQTGGILLMQPEHVLSFYLMSIERSLVSDSQEGAIIYETNLWLHENARDILDESDEILNVRLELIYAMGLQQSTDFSPERWIVVQQVLGLVQKCALIVFEQSSDSIQIERSGENSIPRIRLLTEDGARRLLTELVEKIWQVGVFGLSPSILRNCPKHEIMTFLQDPDSSTEQCPQIANLLNTEYVCKTLLLLRGLLAGGILRFALRRKRWHVNYGLDPSRTSLAVPYRAKGVPSPRSEFSHPDIAIILTCFSYYYDHLTDSQLSLAFAKLMRQDNAAEEYLCWAKSLSDLPQCYKTLAGVNLKDPKLSTTLFPYLRHSKGAIDFYLSQVVFPKDMKEFPSKLSSSGWDLAAEKKHPTTGFSGTNDSRFLLPSSMRQHDLVQLKDTNAEMLNKLLRSENDFAPLPHEGTSSLLKFVTSLSPPVRVILDVGAHILEMTNMQVAQTWLEMYPASDVKAVVFFLDQNDLSVLDRTGRVESFSSSPFARQMNQCLVYLDESHTRGTDLKLPLNYRAAVTLGPGLTKDKLAQACMRMRKLGRGQSVVFLGPNEVVQDIMRSCAIQGSGNIEVMDILRWAIKQTWRETETCIPLWARQRSRFIRQQQVLQRSEASKLPNEIAELLLEPDSQSIKERYAPARFGNSANTLFAAAGQDPILQAMFSKFGIINLRTSTFEEEQERELSPENEREREVERPPSSEPLQHSMHRDVERLVRDGIFNAASEAYRPCFELFQKTSAAPLLDIEAFGRDLWATEDFCRTVKSSPGEKVDMFLRPVHWVLLFGHITDPGHLILSPYEANEAIVNIRKHKVVRLAIYSPRTSSIARDLGGLDFCNIPESPCLTTTKTTLSLGLFAGQIFLPSHLQYQELCRMLGLYTAATPDDTAVGVDGFMSPESRATSGIDPRGVCRFDNSPIDLLRRIIGMRRKGLSYQRSHMGKVLSGELLFEADFLGDA